MRLLALLLTVLLTGCLSGDETQHIRPLEAVPEPSVTPVVIEESLGLLVCVPHPLEEDSCFQFLSTGASGAWRGDLQADANRFTFELEWTAATPASEELRLHLACRGGPGCLSPALLEQVEGPSPLRMEAEGDWFQNAQMVVYVTPANPTEAVGLHTQVGDGTMLHGAGAFLV